MSEIARIAFGAGKPDLRARERNSGIEIGRIATPLSLQLAQRIRLATG